MNDELIREFCRTVTVETAVQPPAEMETALKQVRGLLARFPPPKQSPAILVVCAQALPRWIVLDKPLVTVGRDAANDVLIEDDGVSRRHCRLVSDGESWLVEDLGSRNGVVHRGARVARLALCSGDVLSLGGVCLLFVDQAD